MNYYIGVGESLCIMVDQFLRQLPWQVAISSKAWMFKIIDNRNWRWPPMINDSLNVIRDSMLPLPMVD